MMTRRPVQSHLCCKRLTCSCSITTSSSFSLLLLTSLSPFHCTFSSLPLALDIAATANADDTARRLLLPGTCYLIIGRLWPTRLSSL
ncbi:hypothetical protein M758_9G091400 [Ceratodon purpureus]|nr:hypothetical protein M758_9G091400 [Ceratodon purpureus]